MIEEQGRVVGVDGDYAWIETARKSSCSSCSAKGCGTGALAGVLGARSQQLRVPDSLGVTPGEQVVLGLQESALLRGSLAVYLAPLLGMMLAALFAEAMAPQWGLEGEGLSALFGLLGLTLGLLWVRRFSRRAAADKRYQAVLLRRVNDPVSRTVSLTDIKS